MVWGMDDPQKNSLVQKVKRSQTVCAILKFYSVHNGTKSDRLEPCHEQKVIKT